MRATERSGDGGARCRAQQRDTDPGALRHPRRVPHRCGHSWQSGEIEVWQEHYATAVVRTIVEVMPSARRRAGRGAERAVGRLRNAARGVSRPRPAHDRRSLHARRLDGPPPRRERPRGGTHRRGVRAGCSRGRALGVYALPSPRAEVVRGRAARCAPRTCASGWAARRSRANTTDGRTRWCSIPRPFPRSPGRWAERC